MKTKTVVKIISFCVAGIAVMTGFFIKSESRNRYYKLQIVNGYSRSLEDLNAGINNILLTLEKAEYVNSAEQISIMASQLLSESETAKNALAQLPTNGSQLDIINRFLSQVGNYALSVSKSVITGQGISEEQRNTIAALGEVAKTISDVIAGSQIDYNRMEYWARQIDNELGIALPQDNFPASLSELEENLGDYPTLVYDGPYSDHILEKEPLMIKDAPEITRDKALEKAAEFCEIDASKMNFEDASNGSIPQYRFSNNDVTVAISRKGGYTVYMRKNRMVGESRLDYNQSLEKARRFLKAKGLTGLIETYYYTDEGICVINFAYLDGRTICYTDLIKVGVAVDNGEIMLFESAGYLTNHTERAFEMPQKTAEEAAAVLNDRLEIRGTGLALIPTSGGGETRCYEFLCNGGQNEILVYINAATLAEEKILILLKSDGGTLTK